MDKRPLLPGLRSEDAAAKCWWWLRCGGRWVGHGHLLFDFTLLCHGLCITQWACIVVEWQHVENVFPVPGQGCLSSVLKEALWIASVWVNRPCFSLCHPEKFSSPGRVLRLHVGATRGKDGLTWGMAREQLRQVYSMTAYSWPSSSISFWNSKNTLSREQWCQLACASPSSILCWAYWKCRVSGPFLGLQHEDPGSVRKKICSKRVCSVDKSTNRNHYKRILLHSGKKCW